MWMIARMRRMLPSLFSSTRSRIPTLTLSRASLKGRPIASSALSPLHACPQVRLGAYRVIIACFWG